MLSLILHIFSWVAVLYIALTTEAEIAFIMCMGMLAFQLFTGKCRWQLTPVYVALPLLWLISYYMPPSVSLSIAIASIFLLSVSASIFLNYVLPSFKIPDHTGEYRVGVSHQITINGTRVIAWYPAENSDAEPYRYLLSIKRLPFGLPKFLASHIQGKKTSLLQDVTARQKRFPVIVYEHSIDGYAEENSFLLSELASHGYIVIATAHSKGLADYPFNIKSLANDPAELLELIATQIIPDRLTALADVVDGLSDLNHALGTNMDVSSIHFIGYSLGGGVVSDFCSTYPQCGKIINLDGNPFYKANLAGVQGDYLHISQEVMLKKASRKSSVQQTLGQLYKQDVEHVIEHTNKNGYKTHWVTLSESGHMTFSDAKFWLPNRFSILKTLFGTVPPQQAHEVICKQVQFFIETGVVADHPAFSNTDVKWVDAVPETR